MKISEIIIDRLNRTRLFEMAYDRRTAIRQFENLDDQIFTHLIKILAFHDPSLDHHCSEINAWLFKLNRVKWNGTQHLDKETIMRKLWEGVAGHGVTSVMDAIQGLQRIMQYSALRNDLTYSQVYELLFKIYDKMCADLSRGQVDNIKSYLTEVNKYT